MKLKDLLEGYTYDRINHPDDDDFSDCEECSGYGCEACMGPDLELAESDEGFDCATCLGMGCNDCDGTGKMLIPELVDDDDLEGDIVDQNDALENIEDTYISDTQLPIPELVDDDDDDDAYLNPSDEMIFRGENIDDEMVGIPFSEPTPEIPDWIDESVRFNKTTLTEVMGPAKWLGNYGRASTAAALNEGPGWDKLKKGAGNVARKGAMAAGLAAGAMGAVPSTAHAGEGGQQKQGTEQAAKSPMNNKKFQFGTSVDSTSKNQSFTGDTWKKNTFIDASGKQNSMYIFYERGRLSKVDPSDTEKLTDDAKANWKQVAKNLPLGDDSQNVSLKKMAQKAFFDGLRYNASYGARAESKRSLKSLIV